MSIPHADEFEAPTAVTSSAQHYTNNATRNTPGKLERADTESCRGDSAHDARDATEQHIKLVRGHGFYASGRAEDQRVDWLVDTGCSTTILSSRIFNAIPSSDKPIVQQYNKTLLSADDSPIAVTGRALVNITIGNKTNRHQCIIADVANDGLLGLDFLKEHGMILDFANGKITCQGEVIVARSREGINRVCRVTVADTVTIPPSARAIIQGKATKPLAHGTWLVEPLSHTPGHKPVMTGRTLVRVCGTRLPVEVLNPTDDEITLYRHTNVGLLHRIPTEDTVCTLAPDQEHVSQVTAESRGTDDLSGGLSEEIPLPDELEKLLADIKVPLTPKQRQHIHQLLVSNLSVFATADKPFGRTEWVKHDIVTGDENPVKQAVRRVPFHLRDEAQAEVKKMLDTGVIEPSCSPWASPVVLVRKKDGSLRFCIDYRRLNDITKKDSYPLPRIDDSLDSLGKAKYFTTLDLASGYWQIGLSSEAREKSAFCTKQGLFQFTVMPFGLTNAPATFQRLMERVLAGLQWQTCLVYIDDIILFSTTVDEHIAQLQAIFTRLKEAGLKLKPKKCCIFRRKVKFLGHVVSDRGIETDPDKLSAVKDWPRPQNLTELRSFVGFCSYYRRFLPDFAATAKPLIKLTEKNAVFRWEDDQEQAWSKLKQLMTEAPVLAYPNRDATFVLDTDASDTGIGAVLSQIIDDEEHVVAYGSRVLTKQERRYCVTRRELLAVVHFVKTYRHYLLGRPFVIRTDHAALRWLKSFKQPEGQVARWLETLDTFDYQLIHRPGKLHANADALSRGPCPQCQGDHGGEVIRSGRRRRADAVPDQTSAGGQAATSPQSPEEPLLVDEPAADKLPNPRARPIMTRQRVKRPGDAPDSSSNWLSSVPFSTENLKQEQRADPLLSEVLSWVEKTERPNYSSISAEGPEFKFYWGQFRSLKATNGILTRELTLVDRPLRRQILVPPSLREEVMAECHEVRTAGHLGRNKTMASVRRRFLWPGMSRDVELHVRQCDVCARYKTTGKSSRAGMKDYRVGAPMERVCVDIVGPFPESDNGNKYGLVVTDCFTKFVEIYAMPNQEAATVAQLLVREFFSRYGVCRYLHSDQGTQFESKLFSEMCHLLGIKKTRTTPFRPQSDGQSERNIKTLTKMVAMVTDEQTNWDEHLPFVSMAYRATPHEGLGVTPNFMMFGREAAMPVDVMLPPTADEQHSPIEYVQRLKKKLIYTYQLARSKLKSGTERQQTLYNRKQTSDSYKAGDVVWYANKLRKKGVSPKFQAKWRGPCLVLRVHNEVIAEIQLSSRKHMTVHIDLLKMCYSTKLPSWLKRVQKSLSKAAMGCNQ